jgi:hypothetical protein
VKPICNMVTMCLGTVCHGLSVLSRRMLKCDGWYFGASVLKVVRMHLRNVAQLFRGHEMSGHSKSDPACQSPVSILYGIVELSGSVRSAIVITLRCS